jgi:hypothetical protein
MPSSPTWQRADPALGQYSWPVRDQPPRARPWQLIEYRRRYVSDRTWFGAALAVAFGAVTAVSLLFLIPAAVGVAMMVAGLTRAFRRTNPATGERRPRLPGDRPG